MKIIDRIKHSIRNYYVFYADTTELLDKAKKMLRPLPEDCEFVKLTKENKDQYKSKWDVNQMVQFDGEARAIVNKGEIVAYHYGAYHSGDSMFFKVRKCDYEHTEIWVDDRFRRKGMAVYLLYHTIQDLKPQYHYNGKVATMIKPDNIPSIKLHELLGFKKSHRTVFFHMARVKNNRLVFINIPHYSI